MVINYTKLYDPGAYGSVLYSCLQRFPTKWHYDLDLWPPTLKNNKASSSHHSNQLYQVVWSWSITVRSVSRLQRFLNTWHYELDLWPTTLKNNRDLPLTMVINYTKLYDPGTYGSFCIPAYNVFLLSDTTTLTFDLRPWKTIGIFLSSWWSIVSSFFILELTVQSVSCLRFPTMWHYDPDRWPWKK